MHHSATDMYTRVHISDINWCILGYFSDALCDLWDGTTGLEHAWAIITMVFCGMWLLIHAATPPLNLENRRVVTVYPKKFAHGFCFAVLCWGYTLTDFPISIRLTSLALWQSNDCPSASKATPMNMDKYFMWIHYERLHNHNKAKHNKTECIFLGIYCTTLWYGSNYWSISSTHC